MQKKKKKKKNLYIYIIRKLCHTEVRIPADLRSIKISDYLPFVGCKMWCDSPKLNDHCELGIVVKFLGSQIGEPDL